MWSAVYTSPVAEIATRGTRGPRANSCNRVQRTHAVLALPAKRFVQETDGKLLFESYAVAVLCSSHAKDSGWAAALSTVAAKRGSDGQAVSEATQVHRTTRPQGHVSTATIHNDISAVS